MSVVREQLGELAGSTSRLNQFIRGRLGMPDVGGSYFTFSNENNDLIWGFLAECNKRGWISGSWFLRDDDTLWLDEQQKQGATDKPLTVSDPFSLLETFKSAYRGVVLCDPKVYVSPCVAVTLAGQENLLVCKTPELATRLKLMVKQDLRGKFSGNADALRYIRTKLIAGQDPYLTCSLDPARFDQGGLDHLIASKASVFWITGPKAAHFPGADMAAELEELRAYLATLPLGAVVRGFWWHGDGMGLQEDDGVALGCIVSAWHFGERDISVDFGTWQGIEFLKSERCLSLAQLLALCQGGDRRPRHKLLALVKLPVTLA